MAKLLIAHDTISGVCQLAPLRPYPAVTAANATVTVTPTVGTDGKTSYAVAAIPDNSGDIAVAAFNSTNGLLTLTKNDGTTVTTTISLCSMLSNITPTTTLIGG